MIYQIQNLSFAYQQSAILNDINLDIAPGQVLSLLGRNGAGKSTLFKCMLGLLKNYQGQVLLNGQNLLSLKEKQIAQIVGFVPQNHHPTFDYTVFEFVLLGCAANIGLFNSPGKAEYAAAHQALKQLKIEHLAERLYTQISGGERQQATIARAIIGRPQILIFDEPTAHLDIVNQVKVLKIIKQLAAEGFAIAISCHDPNHALLLGGTTAIIDADGHLQSGTTTAIINQTTLEAIYGQDILLTNLNNSNRQICYFPDL